MTGELPVPSFRILYSHTYGHCLILSPKPFKQVTYYCYSSWATEWILRSLSRVPKSVPIFILLTLIRIAKTFVVKPLILSCWRILRFSAARITIYFWPLYYGFAIDLLQFAPGHRFCRRISVATSMRLRF